MISQNNFLWFVPAYITFSTLVHPYAAEGTVEPVTWLRYWGVVIILSVLDMIMVVHTGSKNNASVSSFFNIWRLLKYLCIALCFLPYKWTKINMNVPLPEEMLCCLRHIYKIFVENIILADTVNSMLILSQSFIENTGSSRTWIIATSCFYLGFFLLKLRNYLKSEGLIYFRLKTYPYGGECENPRGVASKFNFKSLYIVFTLPFHRTKTR